METLLILACLTVVFVLVFDYTNGFHDAANIVATVIASRAMTPVQAVIIVGVFEFLGPVLGGTAVANTNGGVVQIGDLHAIRSLTLVLAGLAGAILWNLATWWVGPPSSSSHALDSQLAAAGVILAASALGAPVSATHVVTSSIAGIRCPARFHGIRRMGWSRVSDRDVMPETCPQSALAPARLLRLRRQNCRPSRRAASLPCCR